MLKIVQKYLKNKYCRFATCTGKETTAGILVIGDEILKGDVIDTNSHFITSRLHKWGVTVQKITVVGDNLQDICREVIDFSKRYDYVLTTGGIGPTHDDITFEAIALAFNERIILHPELVKLCEQFYKTSDPKSPGMKLARVPQSAQLNFSKKEKVQLLYPNISVRNVYIFPGIPQLCRRSFDVVGPELFQSSCKFYTKYIYFNVTEDKLAPILDNLTKGYNVLVGSYPELLNSDYKVKVTIESKLNESAIQAYEALLKSVPKDWIVQVD